MDEVKLWRYSGPIAVFGKVIEVRYSAETYAISEKKARSNIAYQYKRDRNLNVSSNVALLDKVIAIPVKEKKDDTIRIEKKAIQQRSLFDDFD